MTQNTFFERTALVLVGCILGFCILKMSDGLLGRYLNKNGYFFAMMPRNTTVFRTDEFDSVATVSAQGIRNPEVQRKKPEGVTRILALGDSFTYGWGVASDETWARQTEKILNASGRKVEVINAGVPGADTVVESQICSAYADQFDTDVILIGFFGTDDLYQNAAEAGENPVYLRMYNRMFPTFNRLSRRVISDAAGKILPQTKPLYISYNWRSTSQQLLRQYPELKSRIAPDVVRKFAEGRLSSDILMFSLGDQQFLTKILSKPYFDGAVSQTGQDLSDLVKTCGNGRKIVLVLLPPEEMVSAAYQADKQSLGFDIDPALLSLNLDAPMKEISGRNGIGFVSLISGFRSDGCPGCYFPLDSHMTPYGHRRAAEKISAGLLPLIPEGGRK